MASAAVKVHGKEKRHRDGQKSIDILPLGMSILRAKLTNRKLFVLALLRQFESVVSKRDARALPERPVADVGHVEEPASDAVRRERGGMAVAVVASDLIVPACRVHQTENATTASTAKLKTMVAIPATSMLNAPLGSNAIRHFGRHSIGTVDLNHTVPVAPRKALYRSLINNLGGRAVRRVFPGHREDPPQGSMSCCQFARLPRSGSAGRSIAVL